MVVSDSLHVSLCLSFLAFPNAPPLCRELMLVADALRLGGAILSQYPDMLAPQLIGRLLPEMDTNPHVKSLLEQCDAEGIEHCGLVPSYHCSHTPGGPLKVGLEYEYISIM